jgi:hypothetical protein
MIVHAHILQYFLCSIAAIYFLCAYRRRSKYGENFTTNKQPAAPLRLLKFRRLLLFALFAASSFSATVYARSNSNAIFSVKGNAFITGREHITINNYDNDFSLYNSGNRHKLQTFRNEHSGEPAKINKNRKAEKSIKTHNSGINRFTGSDAVFVAVQVNNNNKRQLKKHLLLNSSAIKYIFCTEEASTKKQIYFSPLITTLSGFAANTGIRPPPLA